MYNYKSATYYWHFVTHFYAEVEVFNANINAILDAVDYDTMQGVWANVGWAP